MTTYREALQPCHEHQPGYGRFMPGCIGCLSMTIGNLCDLLDEARQMNDAHHLLFSAHQENFIERIYALEGGDEGHREGLASLEEPHGLNWNVPDDREVGYEPT